MITIEKLTEMGVDKVSKFAGSINVNYLIYMNGGYNGYTIKTLETIKTKQSDYVKNNFRTYIEGVVKALNSTPNTRTEEYLKKAYQEWYA